MFLSNLEDLLFHLIGTRSRLSRNLAVCSKSLIFVTLNNSFAEISIDICVKRFEADLRHVWF